MGTCRRSTARTSTATRSGPRRRIAPSEEAPRRLEVNPEEIATGTVPSRSVVPGTATAIATGGMLPRGADSVLMVEHARVEADRLIVTRPVAPGANVSFAGTDMARGELVLRRGTRLTARETGVLAAIGRGEAAVVRRPRVAILSTGDEIIAPGTPPRPAAVHDANATLLADTVRELGGEPLPLGIVGDDAQALDAALERGLDAADVVLLSGGTSKGAGDLSYRALSRRSPGIVVHGVALKPGKPVCLGAAGTTPVAILPGWNGDLSKLEHGDLACVVHAGDAYRRGYSQIKWDRPQEKETG